MLPTFGLQQTYVKASNTWGYDRFGSDVAIDGDTLVVGAFREDSGSAGVDGDQFNDEIDNSGAVYVFVRDGESWVQQAYLKASNPGDGDYFGSSVAISGDTIVVGAARESSSSAGVNGEQDDDGFSRAGAAYVFTRDGESWSQEAYLKASNPGANDYFGFSVDISGDLIVVGAYGESSLPLNLLDDDVASNSGAAYLYRRTGGVWSQEAFLKAHNARELSNFGIAVAVSGETVLVGASLEDDPQGAGLIDSGAAYVFVGLAGIWTQQAYLKASDAGESDFFGRAVDLDGDRLVVGAPGEDSGETGVNPPRGDESAVDSGAAYIFDRVGMTWTETHYLKAINAGKKFPVVDDGDNFGISVALDGGALIVGANNEDSAAQGLDGDDADDSAPDSGAAYLYRLQGTTWNFSNYVKASNSESEDNYGLEVAISKQTFVIGSRDEDSSSRGIDQSQGNETGAGESGEDSGAVYVWGLDSTDFPPVVKDVSLVGTNLQVLFEGLPGIDDWRVFGDVTLPLSTDLTSAGSLEELAPGQYRFTVDQGVSALRYFVQVRR
ncbi:FG-GAP repeat protein [Verrucomicrobiaceae bacterium 227]